MQVSVMIFRNARQRSNARRTSIAADEEPKNDALNASIVGMSKGNPRRNMMEKLAQLINRNADNACQGNSYQY